LDSTGSGQGPVAGCCECGDEPSGSCATELVSYNTLRGRDWDLIFYIFVRGFFSGCVLNGTPCVSKLRLYAGLYSFICTQQRKPDNKIVFVQQLLYTLVSHNQTRFGHLNDHHQWYK
jgi:hypothetical protein